MLKEFENELIYKLDRSSIKVKVYSYLGELENIKEFEKCIKFAPIILVDFRGESYPNQAIKEANYKLYFINSTSNKSEEYRKKCKFELFDLIESIDKLLKDTNFLEGFRLELLELEKFYENISEYGYLSIYIRNIKVKLAKISPNLSESEKQFLGLKDEI